MNGAVLRGLVLDAYHQVVDNRVFRIMLALVGLMVALSFAIAFRQDGIGVLWFQFSWSDMGAFGGAAPPDAIRFVVEGIQQIFVDEVIGFFGPLFAVAAAAFFVPRMLERGFADTLFSKRVARAVLLLSRYFAGIVFITLLAVALVVGLHLGFQIRSGHSLPGFLWSAPMLIYRFAILFSFTVLVGVLTRSATAALLATLLFFTVNGAVHMAYETKLAFQVEGERQRIERDERDRRREEAGRPVRRATGADQRAESSTAARVIGRSIDVLHVALPKPGDSSEIVRLLRGEPPPPPRPGRPSPPPLSWDDPPGRNAWVSIGTSLAFIALCLALAAWRLARIRF